MAIGGIGGISWIEAIGNLITEFVGGDASTTKFDRLINGGNASPTAIERVIDGGNARGKKKNG